MQKLANQPPRLKKRVLSPRQQLRHNFSLGQEGEGRAIKFLCDKGFRLLDRNVSVGHEELDIVMFDEQFQEVVFVEVKTRQQEYSGLASQAVGKQKLRALRAAARAYLKNKKLFNREYRFDIVTVLPNEIDHYENVSWGMVK